MPRRVLGPVLVPLLLVLAPGCGGDQAEPDAEVTAVRVEQGGGEDGQVHHYVVDVGDAAAAAAITLASGFAPGATRPMPSEPVCCDQALYGVTIAYADGPDAELHSWSDDESPVHDLAVAVVAAATVE